MKHLQIVSPDYINQIWPIIEPFFNNAIAAGTNDYSVDQVKMQLVAGSYVTFVVLEDDKIIGALAVELINYPNHRVAHTIALGGKALFDEDTIKQYENWAKSCGVTKIRAWAKESQARLYKMKMGLEPVTYVVEKEI